MLKFAHIEVLYALIILPVLGIIFVLSYIQRKRGLRRFASDKLIDNLIPELSFYRFRFKFILAMLGLVFIIIAAAGPRVGSSLKEVNKKGREIIIALDVSNSMLAEDVSPNRLEMAKHSINRLLNNMENDKIGLIVFAGDAYTQIPVTNDIGAARLFLNSVSTNIVSRQGTSIGAAINLASKSFSPESAGADESGTASSRAIIVITDGENHEDDALKAAEEAHAKGIQIHTIGLGDPKGVPIPLSPGSNNYKRDNEGNVVVSKLDEGSLKKIASAGGGFYIRAGKGGLGLNQLMLKLNELDAEQYTAKVFADFSERYQYFLAIGIFLLLLELLTMERKSKWISKIKLFS
jgi:Ca-activated chloride channel homolog